MKYHLLSLLAGLSAIAVAAFLSCSRATKPGLSEAHEPDSLPALVIDQNEPLLLEEASETKKASVGGASGRVADNGPCFVCHANYQAEPLASQHTAADVGCVACHGESYAHRNDESNTTPPEVMYPPDRIDPACQKCHASHDVSAAAVIALWLKRCPDKTDARRIVCTDCHGEHRLKVRTVRWDRKTGKLLR